MSPFDVVSFGELLVDFTPVGISENGNPVFERNPGGGTANVACAAAKLGAGTAFIGKVGNDIFGNALRGILNRGKVNTDALLLSDTYKTTLAFVQLDSSGDRSFSFYRKNGADTMLEFDEIPLSVLGGCRYFFCSSVMMAEGESRGTSFRIMKEARKRGIPVMFDVNLRLNLWESAALAKKYIEEALCLTDILKVSEEELFFLSDGADVSEAAAKLNSQYNFKALLVTLGPKGCFAKVNSYDIYEPAVQIKVKDTTAAGDSFCGAFLYGLVTAGKDISLCSRGEIIKILRFANTAGALTTTRKGAISALPELCEVEEHLVN